MTQFKGVRWCMIEPEEFPTDKGISFYFDRRNSITRDEFLELAVPGDEFYGVFARNYGHGYPKSKQGTQHVNLLRITARKEECLKSIIARLEKAQKFTDKSTATVEWVQWKLVKHSHLGV